MINRASVIEYTNLIGVKDNIQMLITLRSV